MGNSIGSGTVKSHLRKPVVVVAYLVERSVAGEDDWILTGSGFYNPSIEGSAEHCVVAGEIHKCSSSRERMYGGIFVGENGAVGR